MTVLYTLNEGRTTFLLNKLYVIYHDGHAVGPFTCTAELESDVLLEFGPCPSVCHARGKTEYYRTSWSGLKIHINDLSCAGLFFLLNTKHVFSLLVLCEMH